MCGAEPPKDKEVRYSLRDLGTSAPIRKHAQKRIFNPHWTLGLASEWRSLRPPWCFYSKLTENQLRICAWIFVVWRRNGLENTPKKQGIVPVNDQRQERIIPHNFWVLTQVLFYVLCRQKPQWTSCRFEPAHWTRTNHCRFTMQRTSQIWQSTALSTEWYLKCLLVWKKRRKRCVEAYVKHYCIKT